MNENELFFLNNVFEDLDFVLCNDEIHFEKNVKNICSAPGGQDRVTPQLVKFLLPPKLVGIRAFPLRLLCSNKSVHAK
jgi:hypothetical protein